MKNITFIVVIAFLLITLQAAVKKTAEKEQVKKEGISFDVKKLGKKSTSLHDGALIIPSKKTKTSSYGTSKIEGSCESLSDIEASKKIDVITCTAGTSEFEGSCESLSDIGSTKEINSISFSTKAPLSVWEAKSKRGPSSHKMREALK